MGTTVQDIRLALRLLRRDPLFTTIAVLTLAVGVAATVLVFSIVNAVLLRPLPYPDAGRLATLTDRYANYGGGLTLGPSVPELLEIAAGTRTFAGVAWADYRDHQIRVGREPSRVFSARVSPNFFTVLGARPLLGRLFSEVDNKPIEQNLIVLSHGLWQRQFGGDPAVIGKVITMNAHPSEIVGVLPASFAFDYQTLGVPEPTEVFTLFPMVPDYLLRTGSSANARRVRPVVRLKPDVSPALAQADLRRVVEQMKRDHPTAYALGEKHEDPGFTIEMTPLQDAVVASSRVSLALLLAGVGMLLVIACANIASLLLAKAVARQPELAIRTALGASRWRLVRQSLTESLVLAACGGTLALLLTAWLLPFVTRFGAAYVPRLDEARLDLRVLFVALALSLLTALLFGVAPSLHTRAQALMTQLMQARRGTASAAGRTRVRDTLVVAQIALSVMLSIGAGLLTRSLLSLQQMPPGFSPEHTLTLQLRLQYYAYAGQTQASTRYEQILRRLEGLPGVESVAMTTALPTRGGGVNDIAIAGRATDMRTVSRQTAWSSIVSPAFFRTLKIPLIEGRVFTQADDVGAPVVAVINETMAKQFWPGESPVGRDLLYGRQHVPIIGVVGDTRASGVGRTPVPQLYRSYLQAFEPNMRLVARTTGDPIAITRTIEQAVWSIDPDQVLFNAATLDDVLREAVAEPRQRMVVSTLVAGVALAMALTGLFGLVSYRVVQRTAELGVRIALGAQSHHVLALVLRHTLLLVTVGLASGVFGALLVSRTLASVMHDLLYGASARDVTTYAAVSAAFVLTALLASALPARRAVRIDPAVALRQE
jgi:putative ABC transport system permease protein